MFIFDSTLRIATKHLRADDLPAALAALRGIDDPIRRGRVFAAFADRARKMGHGVEAYEALIADRREVGDVEAALAACDRCIAWQPADTRWYLQRAELAIKADRPGEARMALNSAWQFAPAYRKPGVARLIARLPLTMMV